MNEQDAKLVTGTDEHGLKIQQAAQLHKQPIAQYCDKVSAKYNVS